jgi:hypothetical protein
VQSRLAGRHDGGLAEAALDATKVAWARVMVDGAWTPWALVADGVIDVDVAAITGEATMALVITTPALASRARAVHALGFDGTVTATQL